MTGRYLLRRLGHAALVVFGVTTLVFVVTRLIGDPVALMLPMDASAEERANLAAQFGFDLPILEQYRIYLAGIARFDLGRSLWQDRPALSVVLERLPLTLMLVVAAIVVATVVAIPLGMLAAVRAGGVSDRITVLAALGSVSVPNFWLGLLLMLAFAVSLKILPASGFESPAHLVLPVLTLTLPSLGRIAMMARTTLREELARPWIRTAAASGVSHRRIVAVHALRNAAVPLMTFMAWEVARMLAGYTVVVETVFAVPGIGFLAVQALERQDVILLQAVVFVVALLVVVLNIATDVAARALDRRISL